MTRQKPPQPAAPLLAPVELEGMTEDDAVSHSLAVLARVYHYNHWIFVSCRDFLGETALEIGSGVGNITQFLLNLRRVVCLEPYEPYRRYLLRRLEQHGNVEVYPHTIEHCPNGDVPAKTFDSAICLNVLEHIEDDVEALRRMKRTLRPGGRAIVLTPALPRLFGEMDRAMGHLRRYTLGSLRRAFVAAGLRPRYGRYMNMAGVPAWWWRGRVQKKDHISERATRLFDRLVPVLSAIERLVPVLFGQSVLVVGEA
jgi:SAM-dependent methyltransferase